MNPTNLFVPFFTTKPGGSGIGLALSRQIAEAHDGILGAHEPRGSARACKLCCVCRNNFGVAHHVSRFDAADLSPALQTPVPNLGRCSPRSG